MMKTVAIFLFTSLCVLFTFRAEAQYLDLRKVKVGIVAGGNVSNFNMQAGALEAGSRFGYQVGGFLRYGGRFYLQSGLTYFSLNSRLREIQAATGPRLEDRVNTRILQLPVLAGANVYTMRNLTGKVRVYLGPAFSLLTSVRGNNLGMTRDDFSNVWVSGKAGVGLDVWFFSLNAEYQMGLNNAFSNAEEGVPNIFAISMGLTF